MKGGVCGYLGMILHSVAVCSAYYDRYVSGSRWHSMSSAPDGFT